MFYVRPIGVFKNIGLKNQVTSLEYPPCSYENTIWFTDSRSTTVSRCRKCPTKPARCLNCDNKFNSEVLLLYNIANDEIQLALKSLKTIPVENLTEALKLKNITTTNLDIFTPSRIRYLEDKYNTHLYLYQKVKNPNEKIATSSKTEVVRKPMKIKYENIIHLMLTRPFPETKNGVIEHFSIINDVNLLPKLYTCDIIFGCKFTTSDQFNFKRHQKTCGTFNVKKIKCKQSCFGKDNSVLTEMVNNGIIPPEALLYTNFTMATFDIETIELSVTSCAPYRGMTTEANLKLLSLAVGSNLPDYKPKCWIRRSMDSNEEERIIKNFLKELVKIYHAKKASLPKWIDEAFEKLDNQSIIMRARKAKWFEYLVILRYRKALRKFLVLDCFGYNSAKFDIPCIAAPLLLQLRLLCGKVSILKKMSSYISLTTSMFSFKDALRFTSPSTYDRFARTWEAPTSKSIWPYSYYHDIAQMKADKKFPPLKAFESKLRGDAKPDMQTYIAAQREFYRRKLLPYDDPDRIVSMYGFLRYYNCQDVQPLAIAIENCFKCYNTYFDVNPITALGLPGLAEEAMFKNYSITDPLIYSFNEEHKEINELFRSNVLGGLVNVYRRHICTFDPGFEIPTAARYAPNGNPFTTIISLDFTSMYLKCQGEEMPSSPGILWTKVGEKFKKTIMTTNHSFKAQQWICYRQATGKILILY